MTEINLHAARRLFFIDIVEKEFSFLHEQESCERLSE